MKLSKNIRYTVRVRDYEIAQVEVGAEADYRDLGIADSDTAHMHPRERIKYSDLLHDLVNSEVDKLARSELEIIAEWSEISPNLAEDFLSSAPQPRSNHARTNPQTGPPPTSRRIRPRGSGPTSPSAA